MQRASRARRSNSGTSASRSRRSPSCRRRRGRRAPSSTAQRERSLSHACPSTGTTSVCPDSMIPRRRAGPIVAKRFALRRSRLQESGIRCPRSASLSRTQPMSSRLESRLTVGKAIRRSRISMLSMPLRPAVIPCRSPPRSCRGSGLPVPRNPPRRRRGPAPRSRPASPLRPPPAGPAARARAAWPRPRASPRRGGSRAASSARGCRPTAPSSRSPGPRPAARRGPHRRRRPGAPRAGTPRSAPQGQLHHHRAQHLDRRGVADPRPGDLRPHPERREPPGRFLRRRAREQHRGQVPARIDRRHDRHVDVAPAGRLDRRGRAPLGTGRADFPSSQSVPASRHGAAASAAASLSKQVSLSIEYGNAFASPFVYANFGLILCRQVGDIETGYKFGQLALRQLSQPKPHSLRARTLIVVNTFIIHWKDHVRDTSQPLLEAYQSGLETGDLEFAAYGAHSYCFNSYAVERTRGG